jgi:hypothetical protein
MTGTRRLCLSLALCLCMTALQPSAGAALTISFNNVANGVWSTGLSNSAVALAGGSVDPHFVLFPPVGCTGSALNCRESSTVGDVFGPASYVALGPNGTYPLNGAWAASNDSSSQWIGPRADQTNPAVGGSTFPNVAPFASVTDPYVYRLPFSLTVLGLIPSNAHIQLRWLSDDAINAQIRLCGVATQSAPVCAPNTAVAGSGNPGPSSATLSTPSPSTRASPAA